MVFIILALFHSSLMVLLTPFVIKMATELGIFKMADRPQHEDATSCSAVKHLSK